jgi:hypothetical protein
MSHVLILGLISFRGVHDGYGHLSAMYWHEVPEYTCLCMLNLIRAGVPCFHLPDGSNAHIPDRSFGPEIAYSVVSYLYRLNFMMHTFSCN